jgi:hypothetical protein
VLKKKGALYIFLMQYPLNELYLNKSYAKFKLAEVFMAKKINNFKIMDPDYGRHFAVGTGFGKIDKKEYLKIEKIAKNSRK